MYIFKKLHNECSIFFHSFYGQMNPKDHMCKLTVAVSSKHYCEKISALHLLWTKEAKQQNNCLLDYD